MTVREKGLGEYTAKKASHLCDDPRSNMNSYFLLSLQLRWKPVMAFSSLARILGGCFDPSFPASASFFFSFFFF